MKIEKIENPGRVRFESSGGSIHNGELLGMILARADIHGVDFSDLADGEGKTLWDRMVSSSPKADAAMLTRAFQAMRFEVEE